MASINNTPRPAYVYDTATNEWIPIGVGAHSHNEIPKTVVDAKGDLIVGTAADEVNRLAVGANGYTLVADSSTSTGLAYSPTFFAGKNKIINGGFDIWQRGTTFTSPATNAYTADRWYNTQDGTGTVTISRQTFTPGNAITGYEPSFFLRQRVTAAGSTTFFQVAQKIEDVRTFAGQTVTFSFWAKADASKTGLFYVEQYFGTGGSPSATVQTVVGSPAYTTSWQRFSYTFTMPSISGKTIGTNNDSCVIVYIRNGATTLNSDLEIWGVQLEAGSTATPFQTATGTIQGELAACQRYYTTSIPDGYTISNYPPMNTTGTGGVIFTCSQSSTNDLFGTIQYPVPMRSTPTFTIYSGANRTAGSIRDMATGSDLTPSFTAPQTGQNRNYTYMGGLTATSNRQYGFHYTASAEL